MARWQWERRQRVRGAPEGPSCTTRVDDIYILSITLRALNYENYGRFPIMGHAGFISSTVSLSLSLSLSFSLSPFAALSGSELPMVLHRFLIV